MPVGGKKKGKDKSAQNNKSNNGKKSKKLAKASDAPENPSSPPGTPPPEPQQEPVIESLPPVSEPEPSAPSVTILSLDQEPPESPESPKLDLDHQAPVEDEAGEIEAPRESASPPEEAAPTPSEPEATTDVPLEDPPVKTAEEINDKNEDSNENPNETNVGVDEVHDKPDDNNDKRDEIHDEPDEINHKPDQTDDKNDDSDNKPNETDVKADEIQDTPDDSNGKPEEISSEADDAKQKANETDEKAVEVNEETDDSYEKAADSNSKADNSDHFEDTTEAPRIATPVPFTPPVPTSVPLPSPSLTEARLVSSPPPEDRFSYPGSPAFGPYSTPLPKVSSPLVHAYAPYIIGSNGTPTGVSMAASVAPSTAPSFTTALHSPVMSSAAIPPYGLYQHQRSGSTASAGRGYGDPLFSSPYQPVRDPSLKNGHSTENGGGYPHPVEFESMELLQRIQNAIPDLSRLLHAHKDTQGKLSSREAEIKQIEAQHQQDLMHKDFYIEALQDQMKKAATESAEECSRLNHTIKELRSEISYLQDKQKGIEESLESSQKTNDDLSQAKTELEEDIQKLNTNIREAQEAHEKEMERQRENEQASLATQKQELTDLFEQIRAEDEKAAAGALEAREKELLDQQELMKAEWEKEKQEMEEARATLQNEHKAAMDEKQSELDSKVTELGSTQSELVTTKTELGSKVAELESKQTELDSTKTELETKVTELDSTRGELDSTKTELETKVTELDSTKGELDSTKTELETKISQLESKQSELDATQAELESKKSELAATVTELETKQSELEAKQNELEETRQKHAEELEGLRGTHASELDGLRSTHEEQLATAAKEMDEKLAVLEAEVREKEQKWADERAELEKQLSDRSNVLTSMEKEKEVFEKDSIAKEKQLQTAADEMRTTIDNMDRDRERLRKTLHSLGEATDLKSTKGDSFFLECFGKLQRLIVDLSKEHFAYLPIDPPKDILAKIPSELPSFLDNTPASRELRSAYVQHVVSKTLTYRIFQPFLFTLGRRFDKADTFFQLLSLDIRRKSVRREAFWRQQTLKAAYTTSDAKQSINVVAAVIVDEIIEHIRHFADPKKLDDLLTGVRIIVKLAAETWRHARVERELVTASMPAPAAEAVANEEWDEYACIKDEGRGESSGSGRHVILRTFPRIFREAAHEDFTDDEERRNSCVYSPGVVVYSDSSAVLSRIDELARKSSDSLDGGNRSPRSGSRSSGRQSPIKGSTATPSPPR